MTPEPERSEARERAHENAARRIAAHMDTLHAPFLARLEPAEIGTLQLEAYSVAKAEIDNLDDLAENAHLQSPTPLGDVTEAEVEAVERLNKSVERNPVTYGGGAVTRLVRLDDLCTVLGALEALHNTRKDGSGEGERGS